MGRGAPFLSLDAFSARGFDARQTTGIVLAVGGNLLVSVALNLTKHAHNVNQKRSVPLPYVRLPIWWCGFAATLLGELGNFAAYGFTEASVIAPLVSESPSPSLALLALTRTLSRPVCYQSQSQKHEPNPGQGAVSVLANAFIASMALGEPLRCRDLLGCLLCAGGGVVIVVSTPANALTLSLSLSLSRSRSRSLTRTLTLTLTLTR